MITEAALLALSLQYAPAVHPDTTHDIVKAESGFNPLAIGVVEGKGARSIYPSNLNEALEHIKKLKAQGKNYSVGLTQINQTNFKRYGVTAAELFNPGKNLEVFQKIITNCFIKGKTVKRGLSCYYSGNFETGQKPEKDFGNTSYIQRIGYVVPSTKQDKQKTLSEPPANATQYPGEVIRGSVSDSPQPEVETVKYPAYVVRGDFVTN